jgi:hypothetical protein
MIYNCENQTFVFKASENIVSFGVKKGCSEDIVVAYYCPEGGQENIISLVAEANDITLIYDPNCPDPPGTGCNTCEIGVELITALSFNSSLVVSVSGTRTLTENGTITNTTAITNISQLASYSVQTYEDFAVDWTLTFILTNGITFYATAQVCSCGGNFCPFDDIRKTVDFEYECANYYSIVDGQSVIELPTDDGFYTYSLDEEIGCLLIDCSPLDCQIYNTFDFCCKECSKDNIELFFLYQLFLNCEDCCTQNILYKKIYAELNKCSTC